MPAIFGLPRNLKHRYVGYNVVGASSEAWAATARAKQIWLAEDGLLASIAFYVGQAADSVYNTPVACVWEDVAGAAGRVIFGGGPIAGAYYGGPQGTYSARWITLPCGLWLPAGTYWIGGGTGVNCAIYYDAGGFDRTWTYSWNQEYKVGQFSVNSQVVF